MIAFLFLSMIGCSSPLLPTQTAVARLTDFLARSGAVYPMNQACAFFVVCWNCQVPVLPAVCRPLMEMALP